MIVLIDIILAASASTEAAATLNIDWFGALRAIASMIAIASGVFFVLAGTLGVLRLPDFYTRLHAAGMTDTLGAELILIGLIIQSGFTLLSLKLLIVAFFLFVTSPTATHAVAHAAYTAGLKPKLGKYKAPSIDGRSQ